MAPKTVKQIKTKLCPANMTVLCSSEQNIWLSLLLSNCVTFALKHILHMYLTLQVPCTV